MPIIVKARKGDDNSKLIGVFKKLLQIDDVVTEVRERQYHKTKALKKKEQNQAIRAIRKSEAWKRKLAKGGKK